MGGEFRRGRLGCVSDEGWDFYCAVWEGAERAGSAWDLGRGSEEGWDLYCYFWKGAEGAERTGSSWDLGRVSDEGWDLYCSFWQGAESAGSGRALGRGPQGRRDL